VTRTHSNVFSMPGATAPTTPPATAHTSRLATSLLPEALSGEFDVVNELCTKARGAYGGNANISLYGVPSYVLTSLERMQVQIGGKPAIGLSPVIGCCLWWGVRQIQFHNEVRQLSDVRKLIKSVSDEVDADAADTFNSILRDFRVALPTMSTGTPIKRQNIKISSGLNDSIEDLSKVLGVSISVISVMAMVVTLSIQVGVLSEHKARMVGSVESFIKRVYWQRKLAERMLELLEESMGWGERV